MCKKKLSKIQRWLGLREGQKISVDTIYEKGFPVNINWPQGLHVTRLKWDGEKEEYSWEENKEINPIYWSKNHLVLAVIPAMTDQALSDVFNEIKVEKTI